MIQISVLGGDPAFRRVVGDLLGSAGLTVTQPAPATDPGGLPRSGSAGAQADAAGSLPAGHCLLLVTGAAPDEQDGVHDLVTMLAGRGPADTVPTPVDQPTPGTGQRDPGPGRQRLSQREREVLDCIANGLTHNQTAARLRVSVHTVNTYVKRLKAKLGHGNKAFLTRAALASQP
ncbi:helix-turn-helix transcriptional regulator [Micromonospora antibiotica]|uniref:Helix-turn-helix transcriptional regulator n=1 Tax=Micromonospora antibiotica TaxID=2807623 RepID=A0ABS3V2P7_9ACTN|nr:LuxR C-terminal-related transcriptional regulator [Micromonospora antibiotica]MBO4159891.1 helix-turn-helix transcriptional regulator [Micromonospora antibiotica]